MATAIGAHTHEGVIAFKQGVGVGGRGLAHAVVVGERLLVIDGNQAAHGHVANHFTVRRRCPPAPLVEHFRPPVFGIEGDVIWIVVGSFAKSKVWLRPSVMASARRRLVINRFRS